VQTTFFLHGLTGSLFANTLVPQNPANTWVSGSKITMQVLLYHCTPFSISFACHNTFSPVVKFPTLLALLKSPPYKLLRGAYYSGKRTFVPRVFGVCPRGARLAFPTSGQIQFLLLVSPLQFQRRLSIRLPLNFVPTFPSQGHLGLEICITYSTASSA
jgi:hypothetical protein